MQLALLQYVFALAVLAYASISDFKSREVSNWVWATAYPMALAMTIAAFALGTLSLETVILSVGTALALGFVLFYFGFYGGADAKALIFVALTLPAYPAAFKPPLGNTAFPPALTMFLNSTILSMIYPLAVFALNVRDVLKGKKILQEINATTHEKILLLFTARKVSLDKLDKNLTYFPSETIVTQNGKLTRKPLHFIKAEADLSPYIINLKDHKDLFKNGVLATPTIPFIIFFTLALATIPFS